MSLSEAERLVLVRREYEKALLCIEQAEANAKLAYWDVVANRLYYALFHAVSSLFIHDGHKVGTHKGAVMSFGMHYVQTGIFSKEQGRVYAQMQTMREKADYTCSFDATGIDMNERMNKVKEMIGKIGELIK